MTAADAWLGWLQASVVGSGLVLMLVLIYKLWQEHRMYGQDERDSRAGGGTIRMRRWKPKAKGNTA